VVVTLFSFFRNAAPNCAKDALPARRAFRTAALSQFWSRKSGCVFRAEVRHTLLAIACNRSTCQRLQREDPPSVAAATYGVVEGVATISHQRIKANIQHPTSNIQHRTSNVERRRRRQSEDPTSVAAATYGAVEGVAIMMPARKNVRAADRRQKGQKACSMNACT
jgi:hypothetical protein